MTGKKTRLRNKTGKPLGEPCGSGLFMYSGTDLLDAVYPPEDWGPWQLDTKVWVLRSDCYEVDLEQCLDSAQVLDRIMQIAQKSWADDTCIAGLIRALNDVLHPQAHLCSFGVSRKITKRNVRDLAAQADSERQQSFSIYGPPAT